MNIILEGNECNFKTTVANKLSESLKLPVVKGSSFENAKCSNIELYHHFLDLAKKNNVIIDRSWISNRVYATLYSDYAILTQEQREYIEKQVENNTILVYLYADENVLKERIRERGDDYVDEKMLGKINRTYDEAMEGTRLHTIHFDTANNSSNQIAKTVSRIYRQLSEIYK